MAKGKDYVRMIHTARWLYLRRDKLSKCPLCERCKERGIVNAAHEVHHIKPVEDGLTSAERNRLMYDPHNLMSLCHDCHVEMHREMGRSGKAYAKRKREGDLQRFVDRFISG